MKFISVLTFCLLHCLWGVTQTDPSYAGESLFTVDGRPVSREEFLFAYRKNNLNSTAKVTRLAIDDYLDLYINFKLKVEEARNRGMDTTESFTSEFEKYHDELRRPYMAEAHLLDSLTRLTYERMKEEVRAAHILITIAPGDTASAYREALSIANRARAGEDFASLASTYSTDPSVRMNKGDLGYFTALQMVYPFENAAYAGDIGDIVGPVRTQFGYHVIQIEDRRPARGEVEVSHIMIRTSPLHTPEEARALIGEAEDQLQNGEPWGAVCQRYSEDPGTKSEGGKLRSFGVRGLPSAPEFEEAAFSLDSVGQRSRPFQTAFGWHIIRLDRRIPLKPLDETAPTLRVRVERDERARIAQQELVSKLKEKYRLEENEPVKQAVFDQADSTLRNGRWHSRTLVQGAVFSVDGETVPASAFITFVQDHQQATALEPHEYMAHRYQDFVEHCLVEREERELLKSNPEYRFILREYYEGILLFDIMEREIWTRSAADTAGQKKYYAMHTDRYRFKNGVRSIIYSSSNGDHIRALHALLSRGDSVAATKFVKDEAIRMEQGIFEPQERAIFAGLVLEPGLFEAQDKGITYLVEVRERIPEGVRPFEQVRAAVINDFQEEMEETWVSALRSKYQVKINEKVRRSVYRDLL